MRERLLGYSFIRGHIWSNRGYGTAGFGHAAAVVNAVLAPFEQSGPGNLYVT
jgi:hypothetical protein